MRSILDSTAIDFIGRTRYYVAVPGERMQKVLIILGIAGLLAAGCAAVPSKRVTGYSASAGDKAADTALAMVGRPYQLKGETPGGFDCSGLVRYSYLMAGMDVPHGTSALRNSTRSVGLRNARKGDLLFFIQYGKNYSHVGIYVRPRPQHRRPRPPGQHHRSLLGKALPRYPPVPVIPADGQTLPIGHSPEKGNPEHFPHNLICRVTKVGPGFRRARK
jgi:hypothetical protein